MDNWKEKEWVESLYTIKKFLFIYNDITDKNSNSNYNINNF